MSRTDEKRKRDDVLEKDAQKKIKMEQEEIAPAILVEPSGAEAPYGEGTTLDSNLRAWVYDRTANRRYTSPSYVLRPGHVYDLKLPTDSNAPVATVDKKEQINTILKKNIPSASTYASTNIAGCWRRNAEVAKHVFAHRTQSGTPVVLLDPVLSELYDDIASEKYIPSKRDCHATKELMHCLSEGFSDEVKDMQPKIKQWATQFGWSISAIAGKADVRWLQGPCLVITMELKKDKSTGSGSSYMQNICYYIENWTDVAAELVRTGSNCPSILIEITGPEVSFRFSIVSDWFDFTDIAVSGIVYTPEGVLCDPFATVSLLHNMHDYKHLVSAARLIGAVTKAANSLQQYYLKRDNNAAPADEFPFFRSFGNQFTPKDLFGAKIVYKKKLAECIYLAEARAATRTEQVIVKFAHSYSIEAHQVCEMAGCAPKLYYADQVGRYVAVVMEYIQNAEHWHDVDDDARKQSAFKIVASTVTALHDKQLVHGDLRSSNILLHGEGVAIIDFDWAGPITQVYPFFMNHADLVWPEGAEDGKPLAFQHDLDWLQRRFV